VRKSPKGGFEARSLEYGLLTEAATMNELRGMVLDAVRCHFVESARPAMIRLHVVKDEGLSA